MRKTIAAIAALLLVAACGKKAQTTEDGLIEYTIFKTDDGARQVAKEDMLMLNMKGVGTNKDTVIFDSYQLGKPYYIPAEEPTLKGLFLKLKKGDSLEFSVSADSLFMKSFQQPAPAGLGKGEILKFTATLVDIYNPEEMQKKIEQTNTDLIQKDSVTAAAFIASLKSPITTPSGLTYEVMKKGTGKKVKKGANVSVQYKGTLLDGTVFDQNMDGKPDFTFAVGMGQVIPGWDEGLQLMAEGDEYKFVIPWNMAYGPRGNGPIPPFSTLVFDVKLIKVN